MGREEFEMPMHKVGIKLLADKQIRNVLPSYENLLDRIKKHREEIGKLNGEKFRHYQYNMMYDNVFSVYGKRGTGKTSVAFTLQKSFWDDREHSYDVVMPIIIPEVIPADCSALGWLLEIVREKISELFEGRRALACNNIDTDDWWRKCKNQGRSDIYEMLFKKYEGRVRSLHSYSAINSEYFRKLLRIVRYENIRLQLIWRVHLSKYHADIFEIPFLHFPSRIG